MGRYTIMAGGTMYLQPGDFDQADLLIPLKDAAGPLEFGKRYSVLAGSLQDYGGVPKHWRKFLRLVIKELESGKKILAFCAASHGRTGCFLASLIALLESEEETPDPIEAVRERHCRFAVETQSQAEAVFALRGRPLPSKYHSLFHRSEPVGAGYLADQSQPKV